MDDAISKALAIQQQQQQRNGQNHDSSRMFNFLTQSFKGTRYQPVDSDASCTIHLCLIHPVIKLRILGFSKLLQIENDDDFIFDSLLIGLNDNEAVVLEVVLEALTMYLEKGTTNEQAKQLFEGLVKLISKGKDVNTKFIINIMSVLTGPLINAHPALVDDVLPYVLSYLIATTKNYKIVKAVKLQVMNSLVLKKNSLFCYIDDDLFCSTYLNNLTLDDVEVGDGVSGDVDDNDNDNDKRHSNSSSAVSLATANIEFIDGMVRSLMMVNDKKDFGKLLAYLRK
eukprot:Pgem_evm1s15590